MTSALSILFLALLFGVYGLLRPRGGCGGNCGACARACHTNPGHDHV
jgi:hypothetical protein